MAIESDPREVTKRLRELCEVLPPEVAITFTRSSFERLLGIDKDNPTVTDRDLTTKEVAGLFDVTSQTVLAWLHQGHFGGEGRGWYKLGRRYYVRRLALSDLGTRRGPGPGVLRINRRRSM